MSPEETEELTQMLVKLIKTDPRVYGAIWECACQCPNVMVQI